MCVRTVASDPDKRDDPSDFLASKGGADTMRSETSFVALGLFSLIATASPTNDMATLPPPQGVECAVTTPNGIAAGQEHPDRGSFGNAQVSVGPFGLWPDGTVLFKPGGAGFITRDGSLGMKFGWRRGVAGQLKIEGRRIDGVAPPLRSEVSSGYGDRGFQATYLIFPTPGCWEVTGAVGDARVTFITRVVKIDDGPAWHRDVP
jgi:hypothetical protein